MTSDPLSAVDTPIHLRTDQQAFQAFHAVLERVRTEVERAMYEAAVNIPVFATNLDFCGPVGERRQHREREAFVEGRWEPFLEHLAAQGVRYAAMGASFQDWFCLVGSFRQVVQAAALRLDETQARLVLVGMDGCVDVILSTIGASYLHAREAQVSHAQNHLQLYVHMFNQATAGMLIFHWDNPPDPGSFRLMAANAGADVNQMQPEVGRTFRELWPDRVHSPATAHFASAVTSGERHAWSTEWVVDGKTVYFEVRCFPLFNHYVGVIFDDVTERKQLDLGIQRHLADLARSNKDLDDFAYVASHDLKSPLRDIDNLAKWVVEDLGDALPVVTAKHLIVMQERIGRMERLLDDLLAYSRIGRTASASDSFAVGDAIDDVLRFIDPPPGFRIEVSAAGFRTETPRVSLEQVLRNLVSNAIKHHGGPEGRITISVEGAGNWLYFTVSDDGPGIPPEFHERVFRMFQTLRPRDEGSGSGIGLAIVKKLVESYGGTIHIQLTVGSGTTFRFSWPQRWGEAT
ncbi:MAG: ATP-binding protein [Candidatus Sericytochromatia bacterium]|nr:ATP-binding protein [Candidatus Sericytochromatia bacterium]